MLRRMLIAKRDFVRLLIDIIASIWEIGFQGLSGLPYRITDSIGKGAF